MSKRAFVVQVEDGRPVSRMTLVGDLDLDGVAALSEAYAGAASRRGDQNVVLDVSSLKSCDLHGQGALRRCQSAGAGLVGAPPCVQVSFEDTGRAHLLPSAPDMVWPAVTAIGPARSSEERGA
jgi:hypothetical protein